MDFKSLGKRLADVGLPLLGAALPVPGGAAIGAALAEYVTGDAKASAADVVDAITADPAARERAAEFQATHRETVLKVLAEHDLNRARVALEDRQGARRASVEGGTAKRLFVLSVVILVASLGAEIAALFHGLPAGVSELVVGRVLGLLDAAAMLVLGFHYGTSEGAGRATELLAQSAPVK